MADLVQTSTSVANVSGGISADFNGGATITAGSPVYLDSNNLWQKAQADTAGHLGVVSGVGARLGILMSDTISGRKALVQEGGIVNPGATMTQGVIYCVSAANAGKIAPLSDIVTSGFQIFILGIAKTSSQLDMAYKSACPNGYSGVAVP